MNQGSFVFAPRHGNTGAQISSCARIDNIEFTVSGLSWFEVVEKFLGLPSAEFEHMERGLRGYSCRCRRGNVQVLFHAPMEKKNVKVLVSGQGIDEIAVDGIELLSKVLYHNQCCSSPLVNPVTQLHLALDEREGLITSHLITKHLQGGFLVSSFRGCQRISGYKLETDEGVSLPIDAGETWYIGSFRGDRLVRCYDKRLERIAAGEEDPGSWYRFELQARRKYATVLARSLVENGLSGAGGIFRGVMDFRELDDENASRRTPCGWWVMFCDGLEVIRTGVKKSAGTLHKAAKWLERTVSRRLAEVHAIMGDGWLQELILLGSKRTDQGVIAAMSREAGSLPRFLGFNNRLQVMSVYSPF